MSNNSKYSILTNSGNIGAIGDSVNGSVTVRSSSQSSPNSLSSSSSAQNNNNSTNSTESPIQLTKLLGKGAFGEVYRGKWHGQSVAIKKIPANNLKDIDKEIKALKQLNHDNIVRYHEERAKNNFVYLIMEYAEQGSLDKWIERNKNNPQNWQLNYQFIDQIVKGLKHLHHDNQMLHRDLKSHNILITKDNVIKLADFGLVKFLENTISNSGKNLTGTPRWMAPEVLRSEKHSYQSDIYSLGMVLWEIVAQETVPFKQFKDNTPIIFQVGGGNLQETIPTDTPAELAEIIELCWRNEPSERISLNDIEQELDNLIHEAVIEVI
ncbi:MAG: Serine/threonine-protein kinase PknD [Mycoplasmataceae bacterium]|nr:Serine/threonine-protein kinase PknD [Mycoplasmataceae bacterium]WNE39998.1 MAG: Serine/threonine-protein kinase PknD [Mycoplasmataceae bacterium]